MGGRKRTGQGDVMAVQGEKKGGPLFRLPNYPAWFAADTLLLSGFRGALDRRISLSAHELSGSVTMAGGFPRCAACERGYPGGGRHLHRPYDHRHRSCAAGICGLLADDGRFWFAAC